MARFAALNLALILAACGGGDDGDGGDSTTAGDTAPSSSSSSGPADPSTDSSGMGSESSSSATPADGSSSSSSTGDDNFFDSSSGGNQCDPVVQGEWNACIGRNGIPDNTLCNWLGGPDANGFIGCLNSGATKDGSNVCFISDCITACDCFAPPATGDAVVTCAPLLKDGSNGCFLDCGGGETCPDGMSCLRGVCFWPPA